MRGTGTFAADRGAGTITGNYLLAAAGVLVAVVAAALAQRWLGLSDLSLVFMLAVLVVAARTYTGPAVLAAVLCFLAYNFFFIEPRYTFYIGARQGVATVGLFLAAALLAGRLASQLAMQVRALRLANQQAYARQDLAQRLAVAADEQEVVQAAHAVFRDSLGAQVWIRLDSRGSHPPCLEPPRSPAGTGKTSEGGSKQYESVEEFGWWFLPLRAPDETMGLIGLKLPAGVERLEEAERRLALAMADDISQALLRTRLVTELETERVAGETERLRSALLSSVSHDLRTPLASILGAAGALENYGTAMSEDDRRSLLEAIRIEGERLDRYIQNLLDMTRLGHSGLTLHRDWIGIDELIGSALSRLQRYQPGARFVTRIDDSALEPVWVHPALIEQALFNVLENAAKFSPADEPVLVEARRLPDERVQIDIVDRGPGIPDDERRRIFDMFYSVERGDRGRQGTGLGLAICRGMIGAHGGEVESLPGHKGRGTRIRITLPLLRPAPEATSA